MIAFPHLTEDDVRRLATAQSFDRGEDYHASGAVFDTRRRGNTLLAQVEGSQYEPYQVTIVLDAAGVQETDCTCPYDWGGICKHIVATLLTCVHHPERFEEQPEITTLIAGLDRDDLAALLVELVEQYPDLYDELVGRLPSQPTAQPPPAAETPRPARRTAVDPNAYRRQVTSILRRLAGMDYSEAYRAVGEMVDQLRQVLRTAQGFLGAGDGESALTILEVMGEEIIMTYPEFETETDVADFIEEMGQPLAEAILSCDLTPAHRQDLLAQLTRWADHLADYGIEEVADVAMAALTSTPQGGDGVRADLTDAQLNVLERRGQTDAFLSLALQTGRHLRYALKLLDLGRAQEATAHALAHLTQANDSLTLAERLRAAGHLEQALTIAERGLDLEGNRHRLGVWLSDVAAGLGRTDLALRARRIAFEDLPSLADYQALRSLAGAGWATLQPRLMEILRQKGSDEALVDVLLSEGQIDEAVAVADREAWNYRLLERVADAAITTHPDWVIRVSQRQAEALINRVQSQYYAAAVRWLQKARAAYRAQGRQRAWQDYLADLRQRHSRKRALLAMLDEM